MKAENNLPPSDPDREGIKFQARNLADEAGLDPKFAKNLLNFIIQEVIQHHKKHQL